MTSINPLYRLNRFLNRFVLAQLSISVVVAIVVWIGLDARLAWSSLVGGAIAVLGTVMYALVLCKVDFAKSSAILHLHFMAEAAKLAAMFLVAVVLFVFFRHSISWVWLFAGFVAAYSTYWFGLLIKN